MWEVINRKRKTLKKVNKDIGLSDGMEELLYGTVNTGGKESSERRGK